MGETVEASEWGQETFKEFFGGVSTWMCRSSHTIDELYYVRILGSPEAGPYYQHYKFSSRHKYVDTPIKIKKSLQLFQLRVGGYPDRIFFSSAAWDVHRIYQFNNNDRPLRYSTLWNTSVNAFRKNTLARLDDIKAIVPDAVDIGLHTALTGKESGELLAEFNSVLREIAEERMMTFYDFDLDVYSSAHFNWTDEEYTHRDWIHHHQAYSYPAAQKLLGRRYSRYMIFKNAEKYLKRFRHFIDFPKNATEILYIKDTSEPKVVYFLDADYQRHHVVNPKSFFRAMHLSLYGDVLELPSDIVKGLALSGVNMRNDFEENSILNVTFRKQAFLVEKGFLRMIPSLKAASQMAKNRNRPVHLIDRSRIAVVDSIPLGKDLPAFYTDGSVLRCKTCREIFMVINETRHSIPSMDVFIKLGKDLSDVIILSDMELYELFPIGDPMKA